MSNTRDQNMDALKETIKTFDKYASQYAAKYIDYEPYVDTYKLLSELLADDARILDVACGPGNIAHYLLNAKPNRKIHGIDLSANMIKIARENIPTAAFEVMDCRDISALNARYDGIVAGFFIPYLSNEEVDQFIYNARAIINAGGILYLSAMEGEYEASGLQTRNNVDWVCIYYYSLKSLADKLEKNGFEVLDVERKTFVAEGEPSVIDMFIYARAN